jgi:hypothetical protein
MSLGIVASLVLSLFVVWCIGAPFFEPALIQGGAQDTFGLFGSLRDSKERALRSLKDLELDYSMGRVSKDDFEESKGILSLEVARILEEIQRQEASRA